VFELGIPNSPTETIYVLNDDAGTVMIYVYGIETTTESETVDGKLLNETITSDGSPPIVMNYESGKFETDDNGTATGENHVSGTITTDGI